jgi:hypothetical protein
MEHASMRPTLLLRLALPLLLVAGLAACPSPGSAQLRVIGVQQGASAGMLQVKVVNRTAKPMRLQRLDYTFAGSGHRIALGQREIEPGAAAVVELPIDPTITGSQLLKGRLFAELDQIIQSFPVSAKFEPGT